jgi:hypothetical protein
MENVEQLFIKFSQEYQEELEGTFYQSELNTHEYFDTENFKEVVHVAYLNILISEYFIECSYKFLNEYYKINNSLKILGTIENDPVIRTCVEIIKDILLKIKYYKAEIIDLLININHDKQAHLKPSNETMLYTINFSNQYKKTNTAYNIFENAIRALVRAENSLSALDHITSIYFDKHKEILTTFDLEYKDLLVFEQKSDVLLDSFLELKLNYLLKIKI